MARLVYKQICIFKVKPLNFNVVKAFDVIYATISEGNHHIFKNMVWFYLISKQKKQKDLCFDGRNKNFKHFVKSRQMSKN